MLAYESSLAAYQNCTSALVLLRSEGDLPSSTCTDSQGPQTSNGSYRYTLLQTKNTRCLLQVAVNQQA